MSAIELISISFGWPEEWQSRDESRADGFRRSETRRLSAGEPPRPTGPRHLVASLLGFVSSNADRGHVTSTAAGYSEKSDAQNRL
jgi:hypothetical protein